MSENQSRKKGYRSERVKRLIQNFHQDFMEGHSIAEIEAKYNVSKGYAYGFLKEIAELNNVSVDMYYQVEHGPHVCIDREGRLLPNRNVSFAEIRSDLENASSMLDDASSRLDSISKMFEQEMNMKDEVNS